MLAGRVPARTLHPPAALREQDVIDRHRPAVQPVGQCSCLGAQGLHVSAVEVVPVKPDLAYLQRRRQVNSADTQGRSLPDPDLRGAALQRGNQVGKILSGGDQRFIVRMLSLGAVTA